MKNARANFIYIPLILFPVLLFSSAIFGGKVLFWGTPALQFVPWHSLAVDLLKEGQLPLWNTFNGMGAPLAADYQSALFYPPNWLALASGFLFGDGWLAWTHTILIMLHLIWGGFGMAWLIRVLGFSRESQVVSGLAFSLSGYFVARTGFFSMIWAGAWLPWIFAAASAICCSLESAISSTHKKTWQLLLAVFIGMQLLAGHAQLAWYSLLLLAVWVSVNGWRENRWKGIGIAWKQIIPSGILGAGLASVQLFLTAQYLLMSSRSTAVDYEAAMTYSLWPWRLMGFLVPDLFGNPGSGNYWGYGSYWEDALYIGVLPFLLSFFTLPLIWKRGQAEKTSFSRGFLTRFLWITILISVLLALGKNTPFFPFLFRYIPTFSMFNSPTRFMVWAVFSLAVLAGIGFESWKKPAGKALYWLRLGTAGGFAITLGAFLTWLTMADVSATFIKAVSFCGLFLFISGVLTLSQPSHETQQKRYLWKFFVFLFVGADLCIMNWVSVPLIEKNFFIDIPASPYFTAEETGRIFLGASDEYFLKFKKFLQFETYHIQENWDGLHQLLIPNLNIFQGVRSVNNFDPLVLYRYKKWMATVNTAPRSEQGNWMKLMDVSTVLERERNGWLGTQKVTVDGGERFRLYNCAKAFALEEPLWQELTAQMKSEDPQLTNLPILLETRAEMESRCYEHGEFEIRSIEEKSGYIELEINSTQPGWLLVSECWYPGWQATIQGKKTTIYPANYLFMAVQVPTGVSRIVFAFRPVIFWIGLGISLCSLAGLLLWWYANRIEKNKG